MMNCTAIQMFPCEEMATFRACTAEQLGLVMQMRWYALSHGGIPSDEGFLLQFAKLSGVSRYKFFKTVWPFVKNFFTETDGLLRFEPDAKQRRQAEEELAKSIETGRKGAEARWSKRQSQNGFVPKSDDRGPMVGYPIAPRARANPPNPVVLEEGGPAAANPRGVRGEAAAGPPEENKPAQTPLFETQPLPVRAVSEGEIQELSKRTVSLGLQAPGRALAVKILQLHSTLQPQDFPLLPAQKSAGLWLYKTTQELEIEIVRQAHPELTPRKPTSREATAERLVQWAREQDRKAAQA